ncbi:MAG: biofilm PGA synthesis N-glycosyltransferase PgaC [Roseivirga sp.]|jgi:biofilm PGA synthesis N-glycosyltransferase PgaC
MLFSLALIYFLGILSLIIVSSIYRSISSEVGGFNQFSGKVSVIVPFRNEVNNLERIVDSLQSQSYPNFEVIFINDHSIDGSLKKIEMLNAKPGEVLSLKVLNLIYKEGKKAAIAEGIAKSSGEIILTTDADCWFDKDWMQQMVQHFSEAAIQMVTGPVVLEGKSFLQKCQRIEFGAIMVVSAALVTAKKPAMANGANLAYRKSAFESVNGFEGIDQTPSGDDELLLMKISRKFKNAVFFSKSKSAIVHTYGMKSLSSLIQQRKRWASKWRIGNRFSTILTAIMVYLFQIVHLVIIGWIVADASMASPLLIALGLKVIVEFFLIRDFFSSLKQKYSIVHFIVLQTFYPFYVLYFGVVSNFGNFQWKGRSFKI